MKILYDHQIFLIQKYGGISKYFCELIKNSTQNSFDLSVLIADNQYLKDDYQFFKKTDIRFPDSQFSGKRLLKDKLYQLNKLYSIYKIEKNKFDLFHPTYYDPYFLNKIKKPYVVTVHDLIDFKIKKPPYRDEAFILRISQVIKKASGIIAISENTKKDLVEILGLNPSKIKVIYHGFRRSEIKTSENKYGRYILFVGSRWGYKNFPAFIKAASALLLKDEQLKIICTGLPFDKQEQAQLKKLHIFEKTFAIGASEKKLYDLYSNALVFVYPTLYEGFGMPILEAFANNCPVCIGNTSSLPEVAGNAAAYFDPNDSEAILEGIEKIIYNSEFREQLVKAGNERLQKFSWKKCAEETAEFYQKFEN